MINKELSIKLFGVDANGGKLLNSLSVSEFEETFNVKIDWKTAKANEFDTQDLTASNENLIIRIEIDNNNIVTHINDFEEIN